MEATEQVYEEDLQFEEGLPKIKEVVQELCMKIKELQVRVVPPEEIDAIKEARENVIASLMVAEAICQEQYTRSLQIGNEWLEDEELKATLDNVKCVQQQMEELQASVATFLLGEKLERMQKQHELGKAQDRLTWERQRRVAFVEPLQEIAYQTSWH